MYFFYNQFIKICVPPKTFIALKGRAENFHMLNVPALKSLHNLAWWLVVLRGAHTLGTKKSEASTKKVGVTKFMFL